MWERLCIWIDMYCLGASFVSEITGDKKKKKKKKRIFWCVVLCCVILSKLKFLKICEKLPDYIGFDMSRRPNRSSVVHNIS